MLPVPTLDHVIVNVREGMKPAAEQYRRLGFTLTPLGRHTLGSINHLAMFGMDYLELLGIPPGSSARTELSDGPAGLSGVAFGTHDADAVHAALAGGRCAGAAAARVFAPGRTTGWRARRRVPRGAHPARPRRGPVLLLWPPDARRGVARRVAPACQRRAGHRRHRHRGGAAGTLGALFGSLFGAEAAVPIEGGLRLGMGLTRLDVVAPGEVRRRFGAAAPAPDGRAEAMAALVLRTASLARTEAALSAGGIAFVRDGARLLVPATEACGVALEFAE